MMRIRGMHAALCSLALSACVGRTTGNTGDDGSGSGSGTAGSTTTAGTDDSGSTSAGDVCDGLSDENGSREIPVLLRNGTLDPVYLRPLDFCTFNLYRIESNNDAQPGHWPPADCEPTCEALTMGGCACPEGCFQPMLIRIESGGAYLDTWPGALLVPDELPPECIADDFCPSGPCPVRRNAQPGTYEATAGFMLWPIACDPNTGDPTLCECTANADGWCETEAYPEGEELDASVVFSHPETTTIEVEFLQSP